MSSDLFSDSFPQPYHDNNISKSFSLSQCHAFTHPPTIPSLLHVLKDEYGSNENSFEESQCSNTEDVVLSSYIPKCDSSVSLASCVTFVDVVTFLSIVRRLITFNSKNEVILDARENRLYQTNHVKGALTTSCHTKSLTKRAIAFYESICVQSHGCKRAYLYDHKTSRDQPSWNSNLELLIDYLLQQGTEVFILDGGWAKLKDRIETADDLFESCLNKELVNRYTYSPTNCESASEDVLNATASKITDFLWLGNERDARDLDLLRSFQITHVINVTKDVPNFFEDGKYGISYCRLSASDNHSQDLLQFFDKAFDVIEEARDKGGHVLVHCWAGVSRSPTIVVAYLMRHFSISVADAIHFLQVKRTIVAPNFSFMGQLERFHNMRTSTSSSTELETVSPIEVRVSPTAMLSWVETGDNVFKSTVSRDSALGDSFKSSLRSNDEDISETEDSDAQINVAAHLLNPVKDNDSVISSASGKHSPDSFAANYSPSPLELSLKTSLLLEGYNSHGPHHNDLVLDDLEKKQSEQCCLKYNSSNVACNESSVYTGQIHY